MNTNTLRFFWNGIKDAPRDRLQPCFYSDGTLRGFPAGTITIYGKSYRHFSAPIGDAFEVKNATDICTDYFEQDTIRVAPTHPLFAAVKAACDAAREHAERRMAKRYAGRHLAVNAAAVSA